GNAASDAGPSLPRNPQPPTQPNETSASAGPLGLGGFAVRARRDLPTEQPMKKQVNRHPIPFNDPDGTPCVRVPLSDGRHFAELYAEDYANLIDRGITGYWQHNIPNRISREGRRGYVQCRVRLATPTRTAARVTALPVVRLILNAPKGRRIYYRDNNPLNLRRNNL